MKTKDTKKLLLTILPVIAAAGLVVLLARRKRKKTIRLKKEQIADEGYETAGDILFPLKNKSTKFKQEWN